VQLGVKLLQSTAQQQVTVATAVVSVGAAAAMLTTAAITAAITAAAAAAAARPAPLIGDEDDFPEQPAVPAGQSGVWWGGVLWGTWLLTDPAQGC